MRWFACASLVLVSLVTGGCSLQSARNEPPKDRRPVIREAAPRPGSAPRPSSITDGGKLAANEAGGLYVYSAELDNMPEAIASPSNDRNAFRYDKTTERTFVGPVVGTRKFRLAENDDGVLARLAIGGEIPDVYLGPEDWLSRNQIEVKTNDNVTVIGSQVMLNNQQVMMARQITVGGKEFHLRDSNGSPYWPGPARR